MRVNIPEFKKALIAHLPRLVHDYYPAARKVASGWRPGDIQGNKGKSCWIGEDGGYKDHGNPDDKGDVIDLFKARLNLSFKDLVERLSGELGITLPEDDPFPTQTPKQKLVDLTEEHKEYFAGRGISLELISRLPIFSVQYEPLIAFLHTDKNGAIGMVKYCNIRDKNFFTEKEPSAIPFPIPHVLETYEDSDFIILCEGQWDALTLLSHGYPALTVPMGTADDSFIQTQWNLLHSFSKIYLAFDPDTPGRNFTKKVAPRLETQPKLIQLPEGEDINEFFLKRGDTVGPDQFQQLFEAAKPYNPPDIVCAEDYAEEALQWNENDIPSDPLPWSIPFGYRPHEYTVYVARTHHGKSNLVRYVLANIAAKYHTSIALASFEETHIPISNLILKHVYGSQIPTIEEARALLRRFHFPDQSEKGRADDVINVSGHRMSTAEIEHTAISNVNISDAASIAIPDEITGEAIILFVIPEKKIEQDLDVIISNYISEKIGKLAKPKFVFVLSDLPKTRTGKIMRRLLKAKLLGLELGDLSSLENPHVLDEISKLG